MLPGSFWLTLLWGLQEAQPALAHPRELDGPPPSPPNSSRGGDDPAKDFSDAVWVEVPLFEGYDDDNMEEASWKYFVPYLLTKVLGFEIVMEYMQTGKRSKPPKWNVLRTCMDHECWCVCTSSMDEIPGCHHVRVDVSRASIA